MTPWEIKGEEFVNCNCDYGCPCQFNAPPTHGDCAAVCGYWIERGHYGDVVLDGLRAALVAQWPGPVHGGDGRMQIIVDDRASAAQRDALTRIIQGEDTVPMATMWAVYSAMCPTKLATLSRKIDLEIDIEGRVGRISAPGVFETTGEPIRNPVTGHTHRARIDLPHGFEYEFAEIGSASTRAEGEIKLQFSASYGQFAAIHLNNQGVVRNATA